MQQGGSRSTSRPAQHVLDELVVEMLEGLQADIVFKDGQLQSQAVISGHVAAVAWLLDHSPTWCWGGSACLLAVRNGHVEVLRLLYCRCPPYPWVPWDDSCMKAAVLRGHRTILKFLHAQGSPWMLKGVCMAAAKGDLQLLEWMRQQDPPFPWDSLVCMAASNNLQTLRWLLSPHPEHLQPGPCPWDPADAACCPDALARLADISLMQRLQLNIQDMPILCTLSLPPHP